jgi:hypothetical protein
MPMMSLDPSSISTPLLEVEYDEAALVAVRVDDRPAMRPVGRHTVVAVVGGLHVLAQEVGAAGLGGAVGVVVVAVDREVDAVQHGRRDLGSDHLRAGHVHHRDAGLAGPVADDRSDTVGLVQAAALVEPVAVEYAADDGDVVVPDAADALPVLVGDDVAVRAVGELDLGVAELEPRVALDLERH